MCHIEVDHDGLEFSSSLFYNVEEQRENVLSGNFYE